MSAFNPRGQNTCWLDGQAFMGLLLNRANGNAFWFDGGAVGFLFPESGGAVFLALIDF